MKSCNSPPQADNPSRISTLRILLVEDDEDDFLLVRDMLESASQANFTLDWRSSYDDAMQALSRTDYDACLVDYRLGEKKGSELIRTVTTTASQQHPPMVMLTGQAAQGSDLEALAAGAADFLEKNRLDPQLLERTLCYAVERDRSMRELLAREHELLLVTNDIDEGLLITDREHNILFSNPAAHTMLGNLLSGRLPDWFTRHLRQEVSEIVLERNGQETTLDVRRKHSEWRGSQVTLLTLHDITAHRLAEEALKTSEERYALAAAGSNDGLWDWNLRQESIYFSPRWLDMAGITPDQAFNDPETWYSLIHPEDLDGFKKAIRTHLNGQTAHLKSIYRLRHKGGDYRWMLCRGRAVFDRDSKPYRLAGSQSDIHRQKESEQQLLHDMLHDNLTGLPNQTLFLDRLSSLFQMNRREHSLDFALMFIDLDDFKLVNDSLGHVEGDRLLVKVARRLKSCLRPSDTLARMGGDEFALILLDTKDASDSMAAAERIHQALERPFSLESQEVFISSSIGIAHTGPEYRKAEELLRDADTAMYRAKQAGKKRHAVFSQDMHQAALKRLQLENELRRAINGNQLTPYFQPIIAISSGRITGFETLVRWLHPDKGMISPGDFIPISEESGLIVAIGEQVLQKACTHHGEWLSQASVHQKDIYISVNLSPRQLVDPALIDKVENVIETASLGAGQLRLEITESGLMENADQALRILNAFRGMGIKIYMDDFGTGYSSLSHLHTFPIDVLKIDQSFVRRLSHKEDTALKTIEVILNLARTLDMDVVAEGIETPEQLAMLRDLGCTYGQGYYFSRPVTAGEAYALLDAGHV